MTTTAVPPHRSRCRPNWSYAPPPARPRIALRDGPARPPAMRSLATSRSRSMSPENPPLTRVTRPVQDHGTTSRRRLLSLMTAFAVAVPLTLTACGGDDDKPSADPNRKIELQVFWWGGAKRAENTQK